MAKRPDAMEDFEEFEKSLRAAQRHKKGGTLQHTKNAYHDLMRGRYQYLNEFMEDMQEAPELDKEMTKWQQIRQQKMYQAQASSTQYIIAAFAGGTALCVGAWYAGWLYTKYTLDVKDGKEYAEKMRALTPGTKDAMDEGWVGRTMRDFKYNVRVWLGQQKALEKFSENLQSSFGEMQESIRRRPSGDQPTLAPLTRHLSGKKPNVGEDFRPLPDAPSEEEKPKFSPNSSRQLGSTSDTTSRP